jgi:dTMP kinase
MPDVSRDRFPLPGFVVIEGIDGAGTTTQLELLKDRLSESRIPSWCTSEPTDHPIGLLLRKVLAKDLDLDPRTTALLFAADRNQHLHGPGGILQTLDQGKLVVTDRYLFSSLTYQGIECGPEFVMELNGRFPLPELVVFLDTPLEVSQSRLSGREANELFDSRSFQSEVRRAYDRSFEAFPGLRVEKVDGSRTAMEIHQDVWKLVKRLPIIGL